MKQFLLIAFTMIFLVAKQSFAQEELRTAPKYAFSNSFSDQFNQLDWINFWIYNSQNKGWRETYLNPFKGPAKADAYSVWGTYYCPYVSGGITQRWQATGNEPRTPSLNSLNWETVKAMTPEQINKLSPIEKADIYFGNKDFKITKHEMYWRGKLRGQGETVGILPSTTSHEGFCNGARAAGALTPEPISPVTLKSLIDPQIQITFQPADIKMLATMNYFYMDVNKSSMIGSIENGVDLNVNAAAFDIALRSLVGTKGVAFFMDADPDPGVPTNVSVVGYERNTTAQTLTEQEKTKYPNAYNKLLVNAKVYYLGEVPLDQAKNPTAAAIKSHSSFVRQAASNYYLYIENQTNNILGGVWLQDSFIPDNIWFASGYGSDDVYVYNSSLTTWDDKKATRLGNPYLSGTFVYNLVYKSSQK